MFKHTKPASASGTLRTLAALLAYPDAEMRAFLPQMGAVLNDEHVLGSERLAELDALIDHLVRGNGLAIEAAYVDLFDCGRATSLHLFEHVHGDSRERGPAMIDLAQTYEKAGLYLGEGQLPDYLPVVLEFVSTQPPAEAKAFLGEMAHIFNAIFGALRQRGTPYAGILGALLELAGEKVQATPPIKEAPLDEAWAEPVVFDGCSTQGQAKPGTPQPIHMVRRTRTDAQPAGSGVSA
ncbi:MAG: nitrate reductase molybdenum cofactor assembly chaperone [Rhodoferax sp.]|nr:nitrate reductase molybdenum cofactor assembly chaperone [Rhodoferax sp.]